MRLFGSFGCDSLTVFQVDVLTGTSNPPWQDGIKLAPNLTSGPLTITWPDTVHLRSISVCIAAGQLLLE